MPKTTYWDDETTAYFLELLGERFSRTRGKIPSTAVYQACVKKMCERYGIGEYTVDSLRSKFQRMKQRYKIYVKVSTNTGIGWDEETQTVVAPDHVIKDFAKVITYTWRCIIYQFIIFVYILYVILFVV